MDRSTLSNHIDTLASRISMFSVWFLYGTGVLLAFITAFEGKHYYSAWGFEYAPFAYGTAIQLFIASEMALLCYFITRHLRRKNLCSCSPKIWIPVMVAFLYASMDESLAFHERLFLILGEQHNGIYKVVFGTPDDLFVITCGIGAMIFTVFFLKELKQVVQAKRLYIAGLFLLILAGSIDYLPPDILQRRLPRGIEELSEYFAGTTFAIAFIFFALDRLKIAASDWISGIAATEDQDEPANKHQTAILEQ